MADTRALLDRIAAFRQRLEQMPRLIPDGIPVDDNAELKQLVSQPERLSQSIQRLSEPPPGENTLPQRLTARAFRLLQDARGLIETQKKLTDDPLLSSLVSNSAGQATTAVDPIVRYHRGTVGLTESAVRMVQAFPTGVEAQLRGCDGLESLLSVVRNRLGILDYTVRVRKNDQRRVDKLAGFLMALHMQKPVPLQSFIELAEELLDEARHATRIRWLTASPLDAESSTKEFAVARHVASHAINVAQVMARLVAHDFEWASKPAVPVVAAMLMDVGLLAVPAEVLAKRDELTMDERRQLEAHPRRSADILRRLLPETGPLAEVVLAHHERIDGTGYPDGTKSDHIPPLSRFLAAIDFYVNRVVEHVAGSDADPRSALTDTLLAAEQGELDRDFTEYLLNLSFHPVGTVVELIDGRIAVVAANHSNKSNLRASSRPVVAVLTDADGHVLPRPEFVDLAAADHGGIVRAVPATERREKLGDCYPDLC